MMENYVECEIHFEGCSRIYGAGASDNINSIPTFIISSRNWFEINFPVYNENFELTASASVLCILINKFKQFSTNSRTQLCPRANFKVNIN